MRVLITGISGYLGSQLANALNTEHELVGTIRSGSRLDRVKNADKINFIYIDEENWSEKIKSFQPEIVINTMALYGRKDEHLSDLINANVFLPIKILESIETKTTFINCGTSLPASVSSYAHTKNQFIELAKEYCKQAHIKFVNLRLEHFFGAGDDLTKFTSYVIQQCLVSQPLKLTAGTQERDFIYIEDLISAFKCIIHSLDKLEFFENIDVGSGKAIKIRDFVESTASIIESKSEIIFGAVPMRDNELMHSCADVRRLHALGWKLNYSLHDAILEMIKRDKQ